MIHKDGDEFHLIGKFYGYFRQDVLNIIDILKSAGYDICRTPNGDMIIMKKGEYGVDEIIELNEDEDDDDFDVDNCPRNY